MYLKKEYDVFIAYHGSYETGGSKAFADKVYEKLVSHGLKCFYFPRSSKDEYKANIIEVMKSRLFVLVTTSKLHIDKNKKIDNKFHYELSTEIDAFYALTQMGDAKVKDAKVLACGEYMKGDEARLHELFANRTHFYCEDEKDESMDQLVEWATDRINNNKTWNETQITSEIKEVFATRASMNQICKLNDLVAVAKEVRAVGISNSELTARINPVAVTDCINNGGTIELLFLEPDGQYTSLREKEEGLRTDRIRNITDINIETALNMMNDLDDNKKGNMRLFTYDLQPRMNMIFVDNCLILQYYSNNIPGIKNPTFFIEKTGDSPIFSFCQKAYEYIKSNAKPIEMEE